MAAFVRPGPTVSLEEARLLLRSGLRSLPPRSTPVEEALGTVLAEPVHATEDIPPFANAERDGYAVRAADTRDGPRSLRLVGSVLAGHAAGTRVEAGQALEITTGAPLPPGADAVCMLEYAVADGDTVVLDEAVRTGQHVRAAGEDVAAGTLVFAVGTELRPAHLGVLASLGVTEVLVHPSPRVGVLSTGDELRSGPGPLEPGTIRDSNRPILLALVRDAGCEAVDLGVVGDTETDIEAAVVRASGECDVIITSGGVSVGRADHMKSVLTRLSGGAVHWMEVAIRPAKPFGFALLGDRRTPVLCMPGNPVSALVSFELLARGSLRLLQGHVVLDRPPLLARAAEPLTRTPDGKLHLLRVVATVDDGRLTVRPITGQGSHQLRSTALTNALALVPDGDGIDRDDEVRVIVLDPAALPGSLVPPVR